MVNPLESKSGDPHIVTGRVAPDYVNVDKSLAISHKMTAEFWEVLTFEKTVITLEVEAWKQHII